MDLWECDLLDVHSLEKYNMYKNILSVIDVFLSYLHLVPVKSNSGPAVTSAFRSLFYDDDDSRRPVWVRTDKCKEFLNKHFQEMLRDEGIHFQVCRNPDLKCAVVELAHRTTNVRLFRYIT
jgi:hypothetical protein